MPSVSEFIRVARRDPLWLTIAGRIMRALDIGSFDTRLAADAFDRKTYAYGLFQAMRLARALELGHFSAIEFGVAKGAGLLALERLAKKITDEFGTRVNVFGFDTGSGLPAPSDYRDLPYHWSQGDFRMDVPALQSRLKSAKLVLGDVRETIQVFVSEYNPPPIGFVSIDLDYYSSTKAALTLFDQPDQYFLPRVFCYFDDIIGVSDEFYSDYTGELLAIEEFNKHNEWKKLAPIRNIKAPWGPSMYVLHNFKHPSYCTPLSR